MGEVSYGNLYSDLLDYVVFSALLFYAVTIAGIFALRRKRPDADRPYKAPGYPFIPLLYIVAATAIMFVLLLYQTQTAGRGLVIVLIGVPVYLIWSRRSAAAKQGTLYQFVGRPIRLGTGFPYCTKGKRTRCDRS